MEPMLLKPAGKDYLWGGTRLKEEYNKDTDITPLAETWECSTHPDGQSVVVNGEFQGKTLAEVIKMHPEYLGTKYKDSKELPIMVKLIDAKQNLSVQVHPDDVYAIENENQNGKTEMWYVLDAKPEAKLIYGFAHPVNRKILKKATETNTLSKHLNKINVNKGDVFFIPPGTVHAIGKGILIAEVQQCSNVTYRIYDYNRIDKNGKQRELHFNKALDVMNMDVSRDIRQNPRTIHYYPGYSKELLCRCENFEVKKIQVSKMFSFDVMDSCFQIILCLNGNGELKTQQVVNLKKGNCIFLPANVGHCCIEGNISFLIIQI